MLHINKKESFDIVLRNIAKKDPYIIYTKGSRKFIYTKGECVAQYYNGATTVKLSNKKEVRLIATVKACMFRYVVKSNFIVNEVENKYRSIYSNRILWNSLPNDTEFYLIDAKHCYWRIAYLMGYIPEKLYKAHANNPETKTARNISLSIIGSTKKREYFNGDSKIAEIECDVSLYKTIYRNIRFASYNLCGEIKESIPDFCIGYRTDGVFTLYAGADKVKKMFRNKNMLFKVHKCVKVDAKYYANGDGELKRFI